MGIGGAMIMPATLSIISNVFPKEERPKAIGIWAAFAAVGIGLGPLFGGLLLKWFDWSSVFLLNVPVAFVALVIGIWLVPNSKDPEPGAFDVPGAGLSIAALVSLVYAIIEAPERGWTDPLILVCFAAAAVLSVAFVRWELRTPSPMLNLEFFRNPRFSVASFGIGLASFALFGCIFALTQYLQYAHGYSALQAGGAMVPLAVGLMMGAGSSSKIAARVGAAKVITTGLVGLGTMLSLTLLWSPHMTYWPMAFWFWGLALSMGFVMGPGTASVMGAVPESKSGVASAMNDVTRQVAGALGTAIIGSLITSVYSSRLDVGGLSESARATAEDSVGSAHAVAQTLPQSQADSLVHSAGVAYTDAIGIGFAVAACFAFAAAFVVRRYLPNEIEKHEPDVVESTDADDLAA
jgi:EmrB/QacA subfamily drug resistance transporter